MASTARHGDAPHIEHQDSGADGEAFECGLCGGSEWTLWADGEVSCAWCAGTAKHVRVYELND